MSNLNVRVVVGINDPTDLNATKVLLHVLKVHPEGTIVGLRIKFELFLKLICPAIRFISPITFPLKTAPWVSEFDKLDTRTILILDLSN